MWLSGRTRCPARRDSEAGSPLRRAAGDGLARRRVTLLRGRSGSNPLQRRSTCADAVGELAGIWKAGRATRATAGPRTLAAGASIGAEMGCSLLGRTQDDLGVAVRRRWQARWYSPTHERWNFIHRRRDHCPLTGLQSAADHLSGHPLPAMRRPPGARRAAKSQLRHELR